MRRTLLLTSMLFAVGGCAVYGEYWNRPGGTEGQFEAAASQCETAAAVRFPPMTMGKPGYFRTPNEWCSPTSGGTNCTMIGSGYLPQVRSAGDSNEMPRADAFRSCMIAGGWQPAYQAGGQVFTPPARIADDAVGQALTYCELRFNGKPAAGPAAAEFNQCVTNRARELSGPRPPA